jgi:hypothetical protein
VFVAAHFSFSIQDVADQLGCSPGTVKAVVRSGELAAFSASRSPTSRKPRLRISADALAQFIAARTVVPQVAPVRQRRKHDDDVIHFFR